MFLLWLSSPVEIPSPVHVKLGIIDASAMGDTGRNCLDQIDTKSMLQLLDQASDSKDGDTSRQHYAISLFTEVARIHKHKVVPYIPRIMDTILRSLPSTGPSSQHLHQACAKVVTSVARYAIDPTKPPQDNQDILSGLCLPLLRALSSKGEPLSAGAAVCLQALVESEKWKWAPLDLQEIVCAKGTEAMIIEGFRTVAHTSLMRSLAKFSGSAIQNCAVKLFKVGTETLQASRCSWQQRVAAAQLLGSLLKVVDVQAVDLDLGLTIQALEDCRCDNVPGVKLAVADALEAAKLALPKELQHAASFKDREFSSKVEECPVMDALDSHSSKSGVSDAHGSSNCTTPSTERSPLFPATQSARKASYTAYRSSGMFQPSISKENLPSVKPRRVLSDLHTSSKLPGDLGCVPSTQTLKCSLSEHDKTASQSSPEHNALLGRSQSVTCTLSNSKLKDDSTVPVQHGNNSGTSPVRTSGKICRDASGIGTLRMEHRKSFGGQMECSLSPDFSRNAERHTKGGPIESNVLKDGSSYSYKLNRLEDDVLCNGCSDFLLTPNFIKTPDAITSGTSTDSGNTTHVQESKAAARTEFFKLASPRRLLHSLQSIDNSSLASKGSPGLVQEDCAELEQRGYLHTTDHTGDGISYKQNCHTSLDSQQRKVTESGTSSCCTSEDLDTSGGQTRVVRSQVQMKKNQRIKASRRNHHHHHYHQQFHHDAGDSPPKPRSLSAELLNSSLDVQQAAQRAEWDQQQHRLPLGTTGESSLSDGVVGKRSHLAGNSAGTLVVKREGCCCGRRLGLIWAVGTILLAIVIVSYMIKPPDLHVLVPT